MANNPNAADNLKPAKKGEIRNPNGRPKGSLSASTILKRFLELTEDVRNPMTGEQQTLTVAETIHLMQIAKARKGELASYKEIMDRMEGKPAQAVDITSDGKPLPIPLLQGVKPKKDKQDVQADNSGTEASSTTETN